MCTIKITLRHNCWPRSVTLEKASYLKRRLLAWERPEDISEYWTAATKLYWYDQHNKNQNNNTRTPTN